MHGPWSFCFCSVCRSKCVVISPGLRIHNMPNHHSFGCCKWLPRMTMSAILMTCFNLTTSGKRSRNKSFVSPLQTAAWPLSSLLPMASSATAINLAICPAGLPAQSRITLDGRRGSVLLIRRSSGLHASLVEDILPRPALEAFLGRLQFHEDRANMACFGIRSGFSASATGTGSASGANWSWNQRRHPRHPHHWVLEQL